MMPELFHWGPIKLHTYGFMWAVGIWLAVWRALRVAHRYAIKSDDVLDLAFLTIVAGVIGGRLGYVLIFWRSYASDPLSILRVWEGGMSYFGGFGLAILAGWWFLRRRRLDVWRVADLAAPSIALGYAIARIGCFAAGCCYGAPTELPWAVVFPGQGHPVHPTQLYSTVMNLIIFFVLARLERWSYPVAPTGAPRWTNGQLFALFLILHGGYRFLNEFFRSGATSLTVLGIPVFTYGHLVALFVMGVGVYLFRLRRRAGRVSSEHASVGR